MPSTDRETRLRTQRAYYYRTKQDDPDKLKYRAAVFKLQHQERFVCPCSPRSFGYASQFAHKKSKRHVAYVACHGETMLKKVAVVNEPNAVQGVEPNQPSKVVVDPEQPGESNGRLGDPQPPIPHVDGSGPRPEAKGL